MSRAGAETAPGGEKEFRERMARLDSLIPEIERLPDPASRDKAREAIAAILELHGAGLARILEIAAAGGDGPSIVGALAADGLVGAVLLLHGLHPDALETRVRRALDRVRPHLGSHGGSVELLGVGPDGAVKLRLEGSCQGCPASRETLRGAIEEALYEAAPDISALEVEGVVGEGPAGPAPSGDPAFTACPIPVAARR